MTQAEMVTSWGQAALRYVEATSELRVRMEAHRAGQLQEAAIMATAAIMGERRVAWEEAARRMMLGLGVDQAWATFYVRRKRGIDALEVWQCGLEGRVQLRPAVEFQ